MKVITGLLTILLFLFQPFKVNAKSPEKSARPLTTWTITTNVTLNANYTVNSGDRIEINPVEV